MSLELAVYDFLVAQESAAGIGAEIKGAVIHADVYEELIEKGVTKWMRVDDLIKSQPTPKANGEIREFNAYIQVQFVARPQTQSFEHRREARTIASNMANEAAKLIYENRSLNDTTGAICDCSIESKRNAWSSAGSRVAASFLLLRINPN